MMYRIKYLLLILVVLFSVACGRRPVRHSDRGTSRGNARREVVRSSNHSSESVIPVITTKSINRTKPDARQMQNDLIGHSLSEGVNDGYYDSPWRWVIREDEISNFYIERIIKESSTEFEVVAKMRLTSRAGKAFDAHVRLCYLFSESHGWYIQFVQSQGMHIVKTGRYNDCITTEYDDWYDCTFIHNNCEIPIEVGGVRYAWVTTDRKECVRFSEVISPHGSVRVYDLYGIDYIEVP